MTFVDAYRRRFTGLELGHGPAAAQRKEALASFEAQGFPTKRHEDWRYTSVADVERTEWRQEKGDVSYSWSLADEKGPGAAFVSALDDAGERSRLAPLEGAPFVALNGAFFQQGVSIVIPEGVHVEGPVHLVHRVDGGAGEVEVHPRLRVVLKRGARLVLIEEHTGDGRYFANGVGEIHLEEGAVLEHHLWQRHAPGGKFISTLAVSAAAKSRYDSFGLWLGGGLSRVDLNVSLDGEEASCRLDGVYVANDGQHVDVHSTIDHRLPHCKSRQTYKGLLGERAHGVFNGKVIVRPDAQKTDAAQANHNLLLADTAEIDTKPQLEIFADDVKCAHGTTVGQLDAEQLFYLRSRGVPLNEAAHLLTGAFALEVTDAIEDVTLRERAAGVLREKLRELDHTVESSAERSEGGAA